MDSLRCHYEASLPNEPRWRQVFLQAFLYGCLCWIQESQEAGQWTEITLKEWMEYSEDFTQFPFGSVDGYQLILEAFQRGQLPTKEELETLANELCEFTKETVDARIYILPTLLEGNPLSDAQWEQVWAALAFQFPEAPKPKHKMTRRTHGRRAITPIKSRQGHKKKKTRHVKMAVDK